MRRILAIVFVSLLGFAGSGAAFGESAGPPFVPFQQFIREVKAAKFEGFVLEKGAKIQGEVEFGRMRRHILSLYEGVEVAHSFVLDDQIFDCMPIAQQPSVRQLGLDEIALDVPSPTVADSGQDDAGPGLEKAVSPLTLGLTDAFGNMVSCAEGTIPFRRVTLKEMTQFRTLEGFFRKTPWSEGGPLEGLAPKAAVVHKYAHAYQSVKNYGGNSWLSLWSPSVNTDAGQVFSLSQHWYVGGSNKSTQTVEGGWQVYPAKYNTSKAVLFIYWTADNYKQTGCYNLDCAGFVQTNSKWALGGAWTSYSTRGGTQWSFQMQWKLANGRWTLFLQGDAGYEAVGYYPASLYGKGQLARFANRVDYGGETTGSTSWPPMGSGAFASAGASQAAYQSRIFYIKTTTVTEGGIWASLKVSQTSPACYKLLFTPASLAGADGPYFYFGGPGGNSC